MRDKLYRVKQKMYFVDGRKMKTYTESVRAPNRTIAIGIVEHSNQRWNKTAGKKFGARAYTAGIAKKRTRAASYNKQIGKLTR